MYSPAASEKNLIGLILHGIGDAADVALESGLQPDDLEVESCRLLFGAFQELYRKGHPINAHTAASALAHIGASTDILNEFIDADFTEEACAFDIQQIRNAAFLRNTRRVCGSVAQEAGAALQDVPAFRDKAQAKVFALFDERADGHEATAKQLADRFFDRFVQPNKSGVLTGSPRLDRLTTGWQPADMIVLAGRPSMGKTAKSLNYVYAALREEMKLPEHERGQVHYFSLEMHGIQLMQRFVSLHAGIDLDKLRNGTADKRQVEKACAELAAMPLLIDDSSGLTVHQLRGRARRANRHRRTKLIVVDYLQLMGPSDAKLPREQQVSEFSRGLKELAKELFVPTIVLSQLNRGPVNENRAPRLSDLRESGSIEQDADVVVLLGPDPNSAPGETGVSIYTVIAEVAKQRNGPVGAVPYNFEKSFGRFREIAEVKL